MKQVARHMERQTAAGKKIKVAMVYPGIILLVAAGVVAILFTFALPPLLNMFDEFGSQLPLATRAIVGFAGFITSYKLHLIGALFVITVLAVWYVRRPSGRERIDRLLRGEQLE